MVENLHRQDLNPLEEAAAYQQLIEDFHLTHDQVAARVGKSRAAVSNTLRLFQLPPAIQKLVAENQLEDANTRSVGTPKWMAPEQSEAGSNIRPATDVWSLGLIAFYLLTGRS